MSGCHLSSTKYCSRNGRKKGRRPGGETAIYGARIAHYPPWLSCDELPLHLRVLDRIIFECARQSSVWRLRRNELTIYIETILVQGFLTTVAYDLILAYRSYRRGCQLDQR